MDVYPLKTIGATGAPFALSPIPGPDTRYPKSWLTRLSGIRVVPDLGVLTTSIGGMADEPIVQRSWGLLGGDKFYGPNFHISIYMKARNYLHAVTIHFAIAIGGLLLAIPLFRKLARRYVYQPGDGPTKDESRNDRLEYRGIATPDVDTPNPPRAFCRAYYQGSLYKRKPLHRRRRAKLIIRSHRCFAG